MKKENVNARNGDDTNTGTEDPNLPLPGNDELDTKEDEGEDSEGRPNRGTGSTGVKRPGGTGGKDQYSLRNSNEQED